jgi:hypothetical protein
MSRNEGYWKDFLVNILMFWILHFYIQFEDIINIIMNDGIDLGVD